MNPRATIVLLGLGAVLAVFGWHLISSQKTAGPEIAAVPAEQPASPIKQEGVVRREIPAPEPTVLRQVTGTEALRAVQIVQLFQDAVHRKDPDAIDRYVLEIAGAGAPCIASLQAALMREMDARSAKNFAYALLRISTPEAFSTLLQAAADTKNEPVKNVILDILKNGLTDDSAGWLVHSALSGSGAPHDTAVEIITGADTPDLLARLVNSAATPEERRAAAELLRHALSPGCSQVLQECAMLPDEILGKAAVSALTGQASEESTRLLLNSFADYGPVPSSSRFDFIVEALHTMLEQNPDEPGLGITIESLMTTSENGTIRAVAAAALSSNPAKNPEELAQAFQKALQYESDPQVKLYLQQGIRRIHPAK